MCIRLSTETTKGCTNEVINAALSDKKTKEKVVGEIGEVFTSIGVIKERIVSGDETKLYEALATEFEVKTSEKIFVKFDAALSEITEARVTACKAGSSISEDDVPRLISAYKNFKKDVVANAAHLRDIFGKMLCISAKEHEERKRKARASHCPDRTACKCPGSGPIVCVCEFFACLDPKDDIKPIIGFPSVPEGFPCLGLTVDTTGSMGTEIGTVKDVIRTFLSSEEGNPGCYVLQPFSDPSM